VHPTPAQECSVIDVAVILNPASGSAGRVNAVATAVLGLDIPLGVLPTGTLNHFAKDLGLPLDLAEAVRVAAKGTVRRVEVGGRLPGPVRVWRSSFVLWVAFPRPPGHVPTTVGPLFLFVRCPSAADPARSACDNSLRGSVTRSCR